MQFVHSTFLGQSEYPHRDACLIRATAWTREGFPGAAEGTPRAVQRRQSSYIAALRAGARRCERQGCLAHAELPGTTHAPFLTQGLLADVLLRNEAISKVALLKGTNTRFRKNLGKCGLAASDLFGVALSGGQASM